MPSSSRSLRDSSPTFGMSRVISSGPSFVSRDSTSCFSMWMLVKRSSPTSRALMTMASSELPPSQLMKATRMLRPRASSPRSVELESASGSPPSTRMPTSTTGRWLVQGPRVGHGLALHVRAHEGPVGVVMLEEGDERGGHRDDLLRADVHELDLGRTRLGELVEVARRHALVGEVTLVIQPGVGLGDVALLFVGGVEVDDLVGDARPDGEGIGLLLLQLGHGLLREALALHEGDRAGPGG